MLVLGYVVQTNDFKIRAVETVNGSATFWSRKNVNT